MHEDNELTRLIRETECSLDPRHYALVMAIREIEREIAFIVATIEHDEREATRFIETIIRRVFNHE
jgi:hypothetical protein